MKKRVKFISVLLAAVLLLSLLSACGENGEETPEPTETVVTEDGRVWLAEEIDVRYPEDFEPEYATIIGDKIYIMGDFNPWRGRSAPQAILVMTADGELTELTGYETLYPLFGHTGQTNDEIVDSGTVFGYPFLRDIGGSPEGELVAIEGYSLNHFIYEGNYEDRIFTRGEDGIVHYLRWFDEDGNETARLELTPILPEGFEPHSMAVGENHTVAMSSGTEVCVVSLDGGLLFDEKTGEEEYITDMLYAAGDFTALYQGATKVAPSPFKAVNLGSGRLGEAQTLAGVRRILSGSGDYDYFFVSGGILFGQPKGSEKSERFLPLLDNGVDGDNLLEFVRTGDSALSISSGSSVGVMFSFTRYSLVPPEQIPEKTTLTLATINISNQLLAQVRAFNASSRYYKIDVTDYSVYEGGSVTPADRLMTDISAGRVPDMIDMKSLPYSRKLSASGLLVDLYELIDADPDYGRDYFTPGVLEAFETNGKLYYLPATFSIDSLVGDSRYIGSEPGWTFEEMKNAVDRLPENVTFMDITCSDMLERLCLYNLDLFVDFENQTCDFENETFYDMLELSSRFPVDLGGKVSLMAKWDKFIEGSLAAAHDWYIDFTPYLGFNTFALGDRCVYKGYPTSEGYGYYLYPLDAALAITTKSDCVEGAWEFFRYRVGPKTQNANAGDGYARDFSVANYAYEGRRAWATNSIYVGQDDWEEIGITTVPEGATLESKGSTTLPSGLFIIVYELTDEEEAQLDFMMAHLAGSALSLDSTISDIIAENAGAYFAGDKTAKEVAALIQSSVSIYLSEQG